MLASFLVLTSSLTYGDGIVRDLPSAGQWSKYRMSEQWSDGTKRELTITIKRLATTSQTPSALTWLEVVFETLDGKTRSAYRFLTPEKSLSNGDPLAEAVDVWVREHDGKSTRDMDWGNFLPRLSLVCMPKLEDETQNAEPKILEVNGETLICPRVSGKYSKTYPGETANADCVLSTSSRIPFGVAHAIYAMRCIGKCDPDPTAECNLSTGTVEFRITDFGNDSVALVEVTLEKGK
jgi:hypothetical protein